MPETITVRVPDIGEFDGVDVVDLLVAPGDSIEVEDSIVTLESDKASMDVPSPVAGRVERMLVSVGDQVGEGDALCVVQAEATADLDVSAESKPAAAPAPPRAAATSEAPATDVLVLGGGPGGYTAAFRAADLGMKVTLVERHSTLGGVCLNVGCIPSKALLHMADVIEEAAALAEHGVDFGAPRLDLERIRARKNEVVQGLTRGLSGLAKQRHIEVVQGEGQLVGSHELEVTGSEGRRRIPFQNAILAAGSRTVELPGLPDDPRILDSTSALDLQSVAGRMLVIGGGIIGLEMATVYAGFGSQVSVVELFDQLMTGTDRDLVRPLERRLKQRLDAIWLGTRVYGIEASADGLAVTFSGKDAPSMERFHQVLVAVGRRPNGDRIGAEAASLRVDERGFVPVDAKQRTNLAHIYAIGDLTGQPMLAHKATHEGKTAAEVIAGLPACFDARAIPSVAYTDPEIAWTGLTEETAKTEGIAVRKAIFPWAASGRALGIGRSEGLTKLLFSEEDGRLLGAGITGPGAGDLIAEATLAVEMGADAEDIGLTVHPHPTLSETIGMAAELAAGTITDLLPPKR